MRPQLFVPYVLNPACGLRFTPGLAKKNRELRKKHSQQGRAENHKQNDPVSSPQPQRVLDTDSEEKQETEPSAGGNDPTMPYLQQPAQGVRITGTREPIPLRKSKRITKAIGSETAPQDGNPSRNQQKIENKRR